jgi:hypothetical protein
VIAIPLRHDRDLTDDRVGEIDVKAHGIRLRLSSRVVPEAAELVVSTGLPGSLEIVDRVLEGLRGSGAKDLLKVEAV